MKYIWEEKDIIPGRYVCKPRDGAPMEINGWRAKWTSMIGYHPGKGNDNKYCQIAIV